MDDEERFVKLNFSAEEKRVANQRAQAIINYLQDLSAKQQYLVVETLYTTFPKNRLLE